MQALDAARIVPDDIVEEQLRIAIDESDPDDREPFSAEPRTDEGYHLQYLLNDYESFKHRRDGLLSVICSDAILTPMELTIVNFKVQLSPLFFVVVLNPSNKAISRLRKRTLRHIFRNNYSAGAKDMLIMSWRTAHSV